MRKIIVFNIFVFVVMIPIISFGYIDPDAPIPLLKEYMKGKPLFEGKEIKFYVSKKVPSEKIIKKHLDINNIIGTYKVSDNHYNMFYITGGIAASTSVKSIKLIRLDTNIWLVEYKREMIILLER